jgi:hypothetical protein
LKWLIKKSEIILPAEITKQKENNCTNQLLNGVLQKNEFELLPKDYYLFGSFREPGKVTLKTQKTSSPDQLT